MSNNIQTIKWKKLEKQENIMLTNMKFFWLRMGFQEELHGKRYEKIVLRQTSKGGSALRISNLNLSFEIV